MALRYLFIDFDSFFASVEQQLQPQLRGRPVGVVPSPGVDTTSCIAASYEAKAYGVKTGTGVREARERCPGIVLVPAQHSHYVRVHARIHRLIHEIIYVEEVLSIDEMYGKLPPHWQPEEQAGPKRTKSKPHWRTASAPTCAPPSGSHPIAFSPSWRANWRNPTG